MKPTLKKFFEPCYTYNFRPQAKDYVTQAEECKKLKELAKKYNLVIYIENGPLKFPTEEELFLLRMNRCVGKECKK